MVLPDAPGPDIESEGKLLRDKIALVTGSSRGIGRAIAIELARRGVIPIIHFREKERRAQEVASEISSLGILDMPPPLFSADIADAVQVENLYSQIQMHPLSSRGFDFLILNAAGGLEKGKDQTYAERVNIWAQVNLVRQALDHNLIRQRGSVVYMTSHVARAWGEGTELISPDPDIAQFLHSYQVVARSKHRGEEELLKMEDELRSRGIKLAVVTAPLVDSTPAVFYLKRQGLLEKTKAVFGFAQPEDVAIALVDYLCNPLSRIGNPIIVDKDAYEKTLRLVRYD
ncbi:hypothetical protein A3A46_04455 [Candidatus Roizmanbacteria bacterium RIFCSPLOWO2_01_FULL_37_13]|nr:MAG: hypothetical protein A3A46_04455 [Candidatus Roizmanbacteria bacterium RIFCSPLOWO2_01_FULL_37_13]